MNLVAEQRSKAALLVVAAVGFASTQDAIVKHLADSYPAYETVVLRGLTATPILMAWLGITAGFKSFTTPLMKWIVLRSLVLCSAYFSFILSIAVMPIANAIAIYFVMPFIVAVLAGPLLGEKVPVYRWLALIAGFLGVLIMVRPGSETFEPASFFALYAAFGYGLGAMMGRRLAQYVPPLLIANIQNFVYVIAALLMFLSFHVFGLQLHGHHSLVFLSRPFVVPSLWDFFLTSFMGALAAVAIVCFITAYKFAASSFVAPFEYSGMIWAVLFGLVFFNDFPDAWTWIGMMIVVTAGLLMMWRDARYRMG
jgi:drug/metabolite transporter (DMT)-like permease